MANREEQFLMDQSMEYSPKKRILISDATKVKLLVLKNSSPH